MIRTILLLTPVYITAFWSILLNFHPGKNNVAKRFLGKFMLACVVVYLTHFLYFSKISVFAHLIEPLYQFASLSVYPLFYIYFRLLLVDKKFSLRKHGIYLLAPILLSLIFLVAILALPKETFILWLYNKQPLPDHAALRILNLLKIVIPLVYVIQVLFTVSANLWLINSHRKKASDYFSDMFEIRSGTVVALNIVLVVCGATSIILSILGRIYFISEMMGITLASIIFSSTLFTIGWLGYWQESFHPTFEDNDATTDLKDEDMQTDHRLVLMERINKLFKNERVFLNSKLTIQDVAQTVGTNRTYVSSIINQQYGVNFCTFVNNYRIEELERVVKKQPEMTNQMLAEGCGFGSVDSLKRAVHAKTGLSVSQWKTEMSNTRKKGQ